MTAAATADVNIPSPREVTKHEYILGTPFSKLPALHIGTDLDSAIKCNYNMSELLHLFKDDEYILTIIQDKAKNVAEVHLLLKEKCTLRNLLKGLLHAYTVRHSLHADEGYNKKSVLSTHTRICDYTTACDGRIDVLVKSKAITNTHSDVFINKLNSSEWLVEELLLETRYARLKL